MPEKMKQLLEIMADEHGMVHPCFYEHVLPDILKKPTNRPYLVISVAGSKGRGKSFLVNILLCYLEHLVEEKEGIYSSSSFDEWLAENPEISGVTWKNNGDSTTTTGIWLSERAYTIKLATQKYINVLLMDCEGSEGTKDYQEKIDTLVTVLSIEMSTIQILNVSEMVREDNIKQIVRALDMAEKKQTFVADIETMFNALFLVIRNSEMPGARYGETKQCFDHKKDKLSQSQEKIRRVFPHNYEMMMPTPGRKLKHANSSEASTVDQLCSQYMEFRDDGEDTRYLLQCIGKLAHELLFKLPMLQLEQGSVQVLATSEKLLRINRNMKLYFAIDYIDDPLEGLERRAILQVYNVLHNRVWKKLEESLDIEKLGPEELINELKQFRRIVAEFIEEEEEKTPGTTRAGVEAWKKVKALVWDLHEKTDDKKREQMEKKYKHLENTSWWRKAKFTVVGGLAGAAVAAIVLPGTAVATALAVGTSAAKAAGIGVGVGAAAGFFTEIPAVSGHKLIVDYLNSLKEEERKSEMEILKLRCKNEHSAKLN